MKQLWKSFAKRSEEMTMWLPEGGLSKTRAVMTVHCSAVLLDR